MSEVSRVQEPERAETEPCPEGFHYIGQDVRHCAECGLPIWVHAGIAQLPPGEGPFASNGWVLRPFEPGEADRIRARWLVSR